MSINDTLKCICNYFPYIKEVETITQTLNVKSKNFMHVFLGTSFRMTPNYNIANMFLYDTSYYYYANPKKMVQYFKINADDFIIDSLERFTMLNFNDIHYEWKYAKNGLPEIILKMPLSGFWSWGYNNSTLIETIYFNYKNNKVIDIRHHKDNDMYTRYTIFKDGPHKSYLQELIQAKNIFANKLFFKDINEYDFLRLRVKEVGYIAHFTYYKKNKNRIKSILFNACGGKLEGIFYYDKNNLVKRITYKPLWSKKQKRNTETLEFNYFYNFSEPTTNSLL